MAYDILNKESRGNVGVGRIPNTHDLGRLIKIIYLGSDKEFATAAAAETLSGWTNLIKTKDCVPFPLLEMSEFKGKEAAMKETSLGQRKINDGSASWEGIVYYPFTTWKKFKTWDGAKGRFALVFDTGKILLYSANGTISKGFAGTIYINPYGQTNGDDGNTIKITLTLDNIRDLENGVTINPTTWKGTDFDSIHDVNVTIVSSAAALLVVRVNLDGFDTTDPRGWITGLVEADLPVIKASDGSAQSVGTFVDNGDGTYDLPATTVFVTGSANLVDPDEVSLTTIYLESTGAASFTIA